MNRWLWGAVAAGAALSLLVAYRMTHLAFVLGSREGLWVYEYIYGFNPRSLIVCAGAVVLCGAPLMLPAAVMRRREWWLVVFCVLAGTAMQLRLRTLTPYTIGRMFESDGSNGYYGATRQYPGSVLLRDFDRLRPTLSIHPRSNMPGKLALVYALERVSLDPSVLARLVIVLSNLGGVILYLFVRDLTDDVPTAMTSLAFYLFVPAKLFFFPILNTLTPAFVIACLYLWLRALRTGAAIYAAACGAALFALTAFEPLPLVTGFIFAGLSVSAVAKDDIGWADLVGQAAIAAAAFAATTLAAWLWGHFNLFVTFRDLARDAVEFNARVGRPYRTWLWRNPIDFAIGAGLCQAFLLVVLLGAALAKAGSWRMPWAEPMAAFTVSLGLAILATDLLGVNRGEVVRLWIFFACLAQVPAAYACRRLESRAATLTVLATSLVMSTVGTSMIAFGQP